MSAEETQGLDVVLTTGRVTETVTIIDETAQAIETENANVSRALTTREIRELPQVGRDPYELVRLTPGIFGDGARASNGQAVNLPNTTGPGGSNNSIFQTENQVQISANGQRLSSNNYMIDGVGVNSFNWGGAALITPNQESIKKFACCLQRIQPKTAATPAHTSKLFRRTAGTTFMALRSSSTTRPS